MDAIHTVRVDLVKYTAPIRLHTMQGDQYSRKVNIHLSSAGIAWQIPADADVYVHYERSDGTSGRYNTLPDGSSAYEISGSTVSITLAPEILSAPGELNIAVSIIDGQHIVNTFPMLIHVHELPNSQE